MSNWTEGFTAKNDSMLSIFDKIVMRKLTFKTDQLEVPVWPKTGERSF